MNTVENERVRSIMTPVTSSEIKSIGYDASSRVLFVKFHNSALYAHFDVPAEPVHALIEAQRPDDKKSVDAYYREHIRDQYRSGKIE